MYGLLNECRWGDFMKRRIKDEGVMKMKMKKEERTKGLSRGRRREGAEHLGLLRPLVQARMHVE